MAEPEPVEPLDRQLLETVAVAEIAAAQDADLRKVDRQIQLRVLVETAEDDPRMLSRSIGSNMWN